MKNLNRYTVIPILITLINIVSCSTPRITAPRGWLPSASVAQHEAFGGWISVRYVERDTGDLIWKVHGELIAINLNQIFILTAQELTSIPIDSISRVELTMVQLSSDEDVDSYRQMIYPAKPLEEFRSYARFPQGLPDDIDRQSLKPKRVDVKISASTKAPRSPQKHQNPTKF